MDAAARGQGRSNFYHPGHDCAGNQSKRMNHPDTKSRLLLLSLLIYSLVLAGLATLKGELLALALPLLVYLGAGLLYRPDAPRLKVTRRLSKDRVLPGMPIKITLTVTNEGAQLEEVLLEDVVPPGLRLVEGHPGALVSLSPNADLELSYTVSGERGFYRFEQVRITASDFLGLFKTRITASAPGQLFVLPEVIRLNRVDIRPRATRIYAGLIPARQGGPGVEFFGVREYQPGDPTRWINSRASARHTEALFVNEFEQERVADVGLILDARRQGDAQAQGRSLFEYGVQATAALAVALLRSGNRVGLFIYGRWLDWTFPGYGKVQQERILHALARAEPDASAVFETLDHLPTRLFPARSQLILVSSLLPQDPELLIKLRARDYRLLVISPDPIAFEQQGLGNDHPTRQASRLARLERELLLRQLRQAGIRVVNWQVETPFQQVAHTALSRFRF
jgi:uncharacterized protein (DUF58 family)